MDTLLEQVRDFADRAHGTQLRKYGADRYIVHPVRVMERLAGLGLPRALLAAALLHDVLEDTPVTGEELLVFLQTLFPADEAAYVLDLVVELTDVYTHAAYPKWNRRRRKEAEAGRMSSISAAAQTVKYADILDNTREIVADDPGFAPKYLRECRKLLALMRDGDPGLRMEAQELVRRGIDALPKRGRG